MHFLFNETIQCKPFFLFLALWFLPQNQQIALNNASYKSQSDVAKMDISCCGKCQIYLSICPSIYQSIHLSLYKIYMKSAMSCKPLVHCKDKIYMFWKRELV